MAQAQLTHPKGNGVKAVARVEPVSHAERDGSGWLIFAGVMFLLVASINAIWGVAALASDSHFAVDELLFGDLTMWGVIYLGVACVQAVTGLLIFNRSSFGAFMGIFMAAMGSIAVLLAIGVYPLWSVTMLVVYGLIIYGLTVYGLAVEE